MEKRLAEFLAAVLGDELGEDSPNDLKLTSTHHSDYAENVVSIRTFAGECFTITVNKGWQS